MIASIDELVRPLTPPTATAPTLWGLAPQELHDRLWASMGVTVVRRDEPIAAADLTGRVFLLLERRAMAIFDLRGPRDVERLVGRRRTKVLRLKGLARRKMAERIVTDVDGCFLRIERRCGTARRDSGRCILTSQVALARRWCDSHCGMSAFIRSILPPNRRRPTTVTGGYFTSSQTEQLQWFAKVAAALWTARSPGPLSGPGPAIFARAAQPHSAGAPGVSTDGVWADPTSSIDHRAVVVGPLWIGRGRKISADTAVIGPAILWDAPPEPHLAGANEWSDPGSTELSFHTDAWTGPSTGAERAIHLAPQPSGKRAFDLIFSLVALLLTLPLYPFIMLAIWIESGGPFFYGQWREGRGGRPFRCWKFRSMTHNADKVKTQLREHNHADGPQFFIPDDPRLTRVGSFLRRFNLDEWPQFWNVLRGEMSIIGPRPSPRSENRCCPAWRDARLSVRPGITGLWQVMRTRRPGADFQEWIRYDIQYVESSGWRQDLRILAQTLLMALFPKNQKDRK